MTQYYTCCMLLSEYLSFIDKWVLRNTKKHEKNTSKINGVRQERVATRNNKPVQKRNSTVSNIKRTKSNRKTTKRKA